MTCHFGTPAHDDRDILPVRLSIRKDVQLCCAGCRGHISASAYLRVVERRSADLPVASERRRRVPSWIRNLGAKDLTEAVR